MSNELKTGEELVFDFLVMSYELCRLGVDTPCGTRGPNGTGVFVVFLTRLELLHFLACVLHASRTPKRHWMMIWLG